MPHSNHHYKRTRNKRRKPKPLHEQVSIVGPDCIQVLQGNLFHQQVALILCGESHYDAIDVTRSGGRFHAKYGWIETSVQKLYLWQEPSSTSQRRVLVESKKALPLAKAKEWATTKVEELDLDDEDWHNEKQLILQWVPNMNQDGKTIKGDTFLVELILQDFKAERKDPNHNLLKDGTAAKLFEWGDLDLQAHELNRRRVSDEEVSAFQLDQIMEQRKLDRKKQHIWTFDDWFSFIQTQTDLHLILEASVPPWQVELHRPTGKQELVPAHDVLRCISEDSEESTVDLHDPSMDGVGSYMDFIYRKFMTQMLAEQRDVDGNINERSIESTWLHCVDTRDLGCEAACHQMDVQELWNDLLLLPQEKDYLWNDKQGSYRPPKHVAVVSETQPIDGEPTADSTLQLFQPASKFNAELVEMQSLRASGILRDDNESDNDSDEEGEEEDDDDDDDWGEEDNLDFTFPSFEGFFGQCTDHMYYSPHFKVSYSPFLAKCCGSLEKWQEFCAKLFFGGTIPDALSVLDIIPDCVYVRSPILKEWDPDSQQYIWKKRGVADQFLSYPYFPHLFHLKAKGSMPPRTWSSQLYANLMQHENNNYEGTCDNSSDYMNRRQFAEAAQDWALSSVARHSADPKGSDDEECGGEWFAAFLRAAHREIYDDIDLTDQAVLLQKNYIASESEGRRVKYNIGKIQIPSAEQAFEEIMERFQALDDRPMLPHDEKIITARVEVLAKIIIDIWVSNLVDFSTVLKIADVVSGSSEDSTNDHVVVVCYMGTSHVRAIADFFCNKVGFRKTTFVGKYIWEEEEVKTLKLPSQLWNLPELFR